MKPHPRVVYRGRCLALGCGGFLVPGLVGSLRSASGGQARLLFAGRADEVEASVEDLAEVGSPARDGFLVGERLEALDGVGVRVTVLYKTRGGSIQVMYEDGRQPEALSASSFRRLGIPVADSAWISGWPSFVRLADLRQLCGVSRSSRRVAADWICCWLDGVEEARAGARCPWVDSVLYERLASRSVTSFSEPSWPELLSKEPGHRLPCPPRVSVLLSALRPPEQPHLLLGEGSPHQRTLGVARLSGFLRGDLNCNYTEQLGVFRCHDQPTYWSDSRSVFLYYHGPSKTWTLAPWDAWAEVKILGDGPLFAHSQPRARLKDPDQAWYEFPTGEEKTLRRVMAQFCKREFQVEKRAPSLLSTLPGGPELLQMADKKSRKHLSAVFTKLTDICRILRDMPTDGGRLAKQLDCAWPLEGLDLEFVLVCKDVVARAAQVKQGEEMQAVLLQRQRARAEARSRAAAEELIAEEQRLYRKATAKRDRKTRHHRHSKVSQMKTPEAIPPDEEEVHSEGEPVESASMPYSLPGSCWQRSGTEDMSESVRKLRHNFPMYDDDVLGSHLLQAGNDLEQAVLSLSSLDAEKTCSLIPLDIPCCRPDRKRSGRPQKIIANVLARTDHAHLPLFCFVLLITVSESEKYRPGRIVRPIPEDRFRLLGDEKGHFWKRMPSALPEVGHIVEIQFYEEDTEDYLQAAHGNYPHQNEDLLCTSLILRSRCNLQKNVLARGALLSMAVDHVEKRWPWARGLGKFKSVQPGKFIWYVSAQQKHLPSVLVLRQHRPEEVHFKYRSDSSDRVCVDFPAGRRRRLSDVAVTAAGFNRHPLDLNASFHQKASDVDFLFILGLARAERGGPAGFNRLAECSEAHQRRLDPEDYEEYCQILLIGIIELRKVPEFDGAALVSQSAASFRPGGSHAMTTTSGSTFRPN